MQAVLVLNTRLNATKCEIKSIKIHSICINKTF